MPNASKTSGLSQPVVQRLSEKAARSIPLPALNVMCCISIRSDHASPMNDEQAEEINRRCGEIADALRSDIRQNRKGCQQSCFPMGVRPRAKMVPGTFIRSGQRYFSGTHQFHLVQKPPPKTCNSPVDFSWVLTYPRTGSKTNIIDPISIHPWLPVIAHLPFSSELFEWFDRCRTSPHFCSGVGPLFWTIVDDSTYTFPTLKAL